jgi:hypothetical protein
MAMKLRIPIKEDLERWGLPSFISGATSVALDFSDARRISLSV